MQQQASTPAAQVPAPPIPKMEAGAPGTLTRKQVRDQVRATVKAAVADARLAAARAKEAAQPAVAQVPAPAAPSGGIPGPTTSTTAPPVFNPDDIPPNAYNVTIAFFVTAAVCVIGLPIARAIARRLDGRTSSLKAGAPDTTPQLRQLQESVDALAIEMERMSEGQRFTAKLLADRARPGPVEEKARG